MLKHSLIKFKEFFIKEGDKMVEKWKLALKEFLKEYEEDENVTGAVLCGSYATDNYNELSDINVRLILNDSCNYEVRGNKQCNSYLIEYYMAPKHKIRNRLDENHKNYMNTEANMLAYGKIIYDLDGNTKKIQELASEYIDKPFDAITSKRLKENNYKIYDALDELKVSQEEGRLDFKAIYYDLLYQVYEAYCEYEGLAKLPKTKIFKILTDEKYKKKYHVFRIPDEDFTILYIKCYEENKFDDMYKNMFNLVDYYYKRQGNRDARTFEIRDE